MGAIDNEEVRTKLKKDPESGYNGLVGDAPDPPSLIETQAALEAGGNEGKPGEKPGDKPPSK